MSDRLSLRSRGLINNSSALSRFLFNKLKKSYYFFVIVMAQRENHLSLQFGCRYLFTIRIWNDLSRFVSICQRYDWWPVRRLPPLESFYQNTYSGFAQSGNCIDLQMHCYRHLAQIKPWRLPLIWMPLKIIIILAERMQNGFPHSIRGSHLHFVNLLFIRCETANSSLLNPPGDAFMTL